MFISAGAGCWAWIPGGGLRSAPFSTPYLHLNRILNRSCQNVKTIYCMSRRKLNRSLGEQNRRFPLTGIQAQHPAPAPHASHARHDRSMARNRLAARAKVVGLDSLPCVSRKNVPSQGRVVVVISFVLARKYNGFLVDTSSLCLRHPIKITVL